MAKYNSDQGYLGSVPNQNIPQYVIIDDRPVKIYNVVVHRFTVGDVEDPDIYAAGPLIDWQDSEVGQWVMQRAVESPVWRRLIDHSTYSYQYAISAKLREQDYTFWCLKWANTVAK